MFKIFVVAESANQYLYFCRENQISSKSKLIQYIHSYSFIRFLEGVERPIVIILCEITKREERYQLYQLVTSRGGILYDYSKITESRYCKRDIGRG